MRHRLPLLAPFLLFAACGGGNSNVALENRSGQPAPGDVRDAAFDRDAYRQLTMASCRRSQDVPDNPVPPEARETYCACVVDHLLLATDDQLRRMQGDRQYQRRAHGIVVRACSPVMFGRPPDPMVAPPEEAGAPETR